jgi:membrane-bound metal-dependent hydrolase YbcI (DUF457 family)
MKGIGHFLTGIAVATCFPEAMRATLEDNSLIILMGGAFGLLPDTLDFRVGRYLWKHDYTHTPDLEKLDARPVAEVVAKAIDEAHEKQRPIKVKLHTLKVSANYHRTYSIKIDPERKVVRAEIGPLKTMGQVMGGGGHLPRSLPEGEGHGPLVAEAPYQADMVNPYHARTSVGIFSGPDFSFVPDNGKVRMDFIPWHRTWAHSPFVGILCGLLGWLIYGLLGVSTQGAAAFTSPLALTAFGVGTVAFWGHTFVDQFGVLGSVLFWPFSDKRSSGFGWTHAASVLGNITLNYVCVAIVFWNLIVYTAEAGVILPWAAGMAGGFSDPAFYFVSLANFATYYLAIPILALHVGARVFRRFVPAVTYPSVEYKEIEEAAEAKEMEDEGIDGPGELGSI